MAEDSPPVLLIHDTLLGKKRPLETLEPGKCGVYCCGPTVYDHGHIGHARAAIVPDVLVRFLRHQGLDVTYVRNITDVDDKIIKRANERGVAPEAVSVEFTESYQSDMASLGMKDPDVQPKVTEHLDEIVDLVERLIAADMAYEAEGDVYYRVDRFGPYGQLSKRKLDDMRAGARIEVDERKENPMDFALWKAAKPGEPSWPSPWGDGRPGWHIECSAMSMKHLGADFDIHTGGRDLIFPHHENEIAQSQGANGEQSFARYWLHNGFVNFAGEKMSKSLGNFFTIREVTKLYHPEVMRYFLIGVHYRSPVNFDVQSECPGCGAILDEVQQHARSCSPCGRDWSTEELRQHVRFPGLEDADDRVAYVYEALAGAKEFLAAAKAQPGEGAVAESVDQMLGKVVDAMRDDLNTAAAIAELSEPLSEVNRLVATKKGVDKGVRWRTIDRFVRDMESVGAVLGVFEREPATYLERRRDLKAARIGLDIAKVEELLAARLEARGGKDWARADAIRDELAGLGVTVRDGPEGSIWSL
jgi:cysteinyl-tRNA synthetase